MFEKMKLAKKISMLVGILLVVVFSIFIVIAIKSSAKAIKTTTNSELDIMSKFSATQVENVFSGSEAALLSLLDLVTQSFETGKQPLEEDLEVKRVGQLYPQNMTEYEIMTEERIIETLEGIVRNNDFVEGAGVFFEPYAYAETIEKYSLYTYAGIESGKIEASQSADYTQEKFYKETKEKNGILLINPVLVRGEFVVSMSIPIVVDGVFTGIASVDVNVSKFKEFSLNNPAYPTMYTCILDLTGTLIYDSENPDGTSIGINMVEWTPNPEDNTITQAGYDTKQPFTTIIHADNGVDMYRFYYPIQAGDQTWWSLTAIEEPEMLASVTTTSMLLISIALIALIVLIVCIGAILRKMINPIHQVVSAAQNISEGNFTFNLETTSKDEIGILINTFSDTTKMLNHVITDIASILNEMANKNFTVKAAEGYVGGLKPIELSINCIVQNLSAILQEMNVAAQEVANGSEQVSSAAQSLSQGATEQANSIDELSFTISEISREISNNVKSATNAKIESEKSKNDIKLSNDQMQDMMHAMENISTKSGEIGKIIQSIDDIAFQTNILALNAAVEAARAGEAGKGFAVVADEVRNLAGKSAESAKNTAVLIEETIRAVESGTTIVNMTAATMNTVVTSSDMVTHIIEDIVVQSEKQAQAVAQVSVSIEQISSVVQTNAAISEESAASSEELVAQAQMLKNRVGEFNLNGSYDGNRNFETKVFTRSIPHIDASIESTIDNNKY